MTASLIVWICIVSPIVVIGQTVNAAYVKALYQKYPTQKSDFCNSCKLWVNPYYRAIGDTDRHASVLTRYVYIRQHRLQQEIMNLPRNGIYTA